MLHVVIREGLVDEAFVADHTTGFDEVAASVEAWTPERAAEVCGVPAADIERAAELYGQAGKAMLSHARGLEHQVMGSRNAMAAINLCLATGNIGRPGAGYDTITGQGNGQGGREHGQKCDQLPGMRHFHDPGVIEHSPRCGASNPRRCPGPVSPSSASSSGWKPARSAACSTCAPTPWCRGPTRPAPTSGSSASSHAASAEEPDDEYPLRLTPGQPPPSPGQHRARQLRAPTGGGPFPAVTPPVPKGRLGGEMVALVGGLARRFRLTSLVERHDSFAAMGGFAFVNGCIAIAVMSLGALATGSPFVFPSLGPTAFLHFYTPMAPAACPRNTLCGHAVGVVAGLVSLQLFGLADAGPALATGVDGARVAATALSLGLTSGTMV